MTQLPQNSDAWQRAGADARPPASGQQIERDPAARPDPAGQEPPADDDVERPIADRDRQVDADRAAESGRASP